MMWNKHTKPLSWSAISQFQYDKEKWYEKYVLGIKEPPSREMEFGSVVGKMIEKDPTYLPMIPRCKTMEYKFHVTFGDIEILGYADSFETGRLEEYKTGKSEWNKKKVDGHGQLTMYLLMNYIQNNQLPEDVKVNLHWMPTEDKGDFSIGFKHPIEDNIKHFKTKRTTKDILEFGAHINNTVKEMESYALAHE